MNFAKKVFLSLVITAVLGLSRTDSFAQTTPAIPNGTLVHAAGDGAIYFIDNGTRRPIDSEEAFRIQGFRWVIREVSATELAYFPVGDIITKDSTIFFPGQEQVAPDISPFAPSDLQLVNRGGRALLLFTTTLWNKGRGPIELNATTGNSTGNEVYETAQRIILPNGQVRDKVVGNLFWHAPHGHFHYDDFASYVLEILPSAGLSPNFLTSPISQVAPAPAVWTPGLEPELPHTHAAALPGDLVPIPQVQGTSVVNPQVVNKSTFCFFENQRILLPTEGVSKSTKTYNICGKFKQGISVGWADVYPYTLPDQNFDVTDLPAGVYRIAFVLDPHLHLMETNRANNVGVSFVYINPPAGTMQVLAMGAPFATPLNKYPDGMLVRSENSPDVYTIQGNKKKHLHNTPAEQVFILPQGVFDAIPDLSLIQVTGSPTIYALNEHGYRRGITSLEVFNSYALRFQNVTQISQADLAKYPETDLVKLPTDNTVYSISTRQPVGSGANLESVHVINQKDFESYMAQVAASDLFVPWDIAFLPDGDMLVPERSGTLRRLGKNPGVVTVPSVLNTGEGGLMGIVLHPKFAENNLIYLYYTTAQNGQKNRVVRFRLDGIQLSQQTIILDNIPSAIYHDGGRMAFGPDGMLYIVTGDANTPALAQDLNSLAGKTLRLTPEGQIPADNPFGTAVWSYGHRNSQGIAWDSFGRMWETEHGRSGATTGFDELNLIEKGKNYGWPTIQGSETRAGMVTPVINSGANETWAPSGLVFANGSLYFSGLLGSKLYQVRFNQDGGYRDLTTHYSGQFGRLRATVLGPDGSLYLSTSNRDGRGTVLPGDDKILRIYPGFLQGTR